MGERANRAVVKDKGKREIKQRVSHRRGSRVLSYLLHFMWNCMCPGGLSWKGGEV